MSAVDLPRPDPAELTELASRLVRIPSFPGTPRQEEAVARELAAFLSARGLRPELREVRAGRPNLVCTIAGAEPGPHLLLCGHTDTVPLNADDVGTGLSGEICDGWLLGRGSVDMKGAVAAMAVAVGILARSGGLDRGAVTLAAVVDEEMEGLGVERLLADGIAAEGAIVGEPTGNRPCLGHKGLEWLEIELVGKAAHGGTPQAGVNAINAAARFVRLVEEELLPVLARREHPLLGRPTLNFGTVRGGDQPSTVAGRCVLAADRRSVPGEDYRSMVAELEGLLSRVAAEMPGVGTQVRRFPGGTGSMERLPFATREDAPIARAVAAACGSGSPQRSFGAFPAWTDGGLLAVQGGIPTVVLGPGDLSLAHSPREALAVGELVEAARIYLAAAAELSRLA